MRGRPLAFLAVVTLGWAGARTAMLWPETPLAQDSATGRVAAQTRADDFLPFALTGAVAVAVAAAPAPVRARSLQPAQRRRAMMTDAQMLAAFGLHFFVEDRPTPRLPTVPLPSRHAGTGDSVAAAVLSAQPAPSRWSVSAWLAARGGPADPRLGPLLGASQAGARLSYALDEDRSLAVFARVATPLRGGGAEFAGGAQWRPTAAPITGFVEARRRADGRVVPAVGMFGGIDAGLPADFRLESYAQAGWVGEAGAFAEGQARAAHPLGTVAGLRLDAGVGTWGAAQRGAARLDVGPSASATLPLGRGSARLSLDWRQRVAGRAAPGSGPVLALGAGF